jgi:uncharacterized membrane protein YdcZ (DUF606 family)
MKPEVLPVIIGLLAASILVFSLLISKAPGAREKKKATLAYILVAGLCIGVCGLLQYPLRDQALVFFIILQILMLLLGILHVVLGKKLLHWPQKESFTGEFLLTLVTAFLGGTVLLLSFALIKMENFNLLMLSALVWFFIPFLFSKAVAFYALVPDRVFKTWSYPDKPLPDPTDSELAAPMVISFEFKKKTDDQAFTSFRAKAPKDIQFGRLFYFFINDYNGRHPEGTIEAVSRPNLPYQWVFHFKPRFLTGKRYLDPDESVYHNKIKENSIIVCHRIIEE